MEPRRRFSLADAIRHARLKKGLSAHSLSIQAGLSPSYTGKLEAGKIEPSVRAFGLLAIALGLTEAEVFFCVVNEAWSPSPRDTKVRP